MTPLRYVGRYPDTEGAIAPHQYADKANTDTKVTTDFVNDTVDSQVTSLATTAYVNQQDDKKALKTSVTAADELYVPASGHGLALLDSSGYVASSQIPTTVIAGRASSSYTGTLTGGTVSSAGLRSLLMGTITIPDPGFPYVVLVFGWVSGSDPNGTAKNRWSGTGNTGKLVAMPPAGNDAIYGWGVCAGSAKSNLYSISPAASMNASNQKVTGSLTVNVYGSILTEAIGQTYTFGSGSFFALTLPAAS
jgi:hypothetical protein